MTRREQPVHERIQQAEGLFLTLMGPDATPEDWDRYENLVRTSAEHRKSFAQYETIWQGLDEIGAARLLSDGFAEKMNTDRRTKIDSMTSAQSGALAGNTRSSATSGVRRWFEELRWSWAIAATLVVLLIVGGLGVQNFVSSTPKVLRFATQIREHKEIELPDGSSLSLGARTSVNVRYTRTTRLIELRSGEILAVVAHDESRPFILVTDDIMLMATGTAFNVRNGSAYSTVSVVQGSVSVVLQTASESVVQIQPNSSTPTLGSFGGGTSLRSGQQLRAARNTELGLVREVDIGRVVSWQSGQLYFLEDDLSTVFEDVMRYSDVTFMLTDQSIGDRIYTGSFRPDSVEAWLDAMERAYSLKVTRVGSDWIAIAPIE